MFETTLAADRLRELPPGPELAAAIADADPRVLSAHDLVDYIAATERLTSWVAAVQLGAVAEFAGRRPGAPPYLPPGPGDRLPAGGVNEFVDLEIASALRLSPAAGHARFDLAVRLAVIPATLEALRGGVIDLPKARAIADAVSSLEDPAARAVQDRVLGRAPGQTVGQLRACLQRAVLAHDPASAQIRHDHAAAGRRVLLTPQADGMAEIWALLPADAALGLYQAVTALADAAKAPGDLRNIDQRRADALGDLARTVLDSTPLPPTQRRRPQLHLTLAATTALGFDDNPGELAGYGPIPAEMARRIAADATWRRILTDPLSGVLLDYGTTTYAPPAALTRHVLTRDATCQWPGCRQPAVRCDLDHRDPYPRGPTAEHNLHPLCRRHHRAKTEAGWTYTAAPDRTLTWTSPTGHKTQRSPHIQLGDPPNQPPDPPGHPPDPGDRLNDPADQLGHPPDQPLQLPGPLRRSHERAIALEEATDKTEKARPAARTSAQPDLADGDIPPF